MKFLLLLVARRCATTIGFFLILSCDKKRQKFHCSCKQALRNVAIASAVHLVAVVVRPRDPEVIAAQRREQGRKLLAEIGQRSAACEKSYGN
jgi:hypothetical protein